MQSRAAWPVLLLTGAVTGCGLLLPFTSPGAKLELVPLPVTYFAWLAVILISYSVLTELVKVWYRRRFGSWL